MILAHGDKIMYYAVHRTNKYLKHHGIEGQKWGVRNGPPYPLKNNSYSNELRNTFGHHVRFKQSIMPESERALAKDLASRLPEADLPYKISKNYVNSLFETNLSDSEKEYALVDQSDSFYKYHGINLGPGNYKVYKWEHIERKPKHEGDASVMEMFGPNYEEELDEYRKSLKPYQRDEKDNF